MRAGGGAGLIPFPSPEPSPMAEDDPSPPKPPTLPAAGCGWLFGGFFASGLAGMGLAFWLVQNNAPPWLPPVAFFAPPVLVLVVFGSVAVPRFLRQVREMQRNAPSPESVAAPAAGEGVEAGTAPAVAADADDFPTVPFVPTTPGKVLAHRLERAGLAPGCQFGCAVGMAAFWNGIVGVFAYKQIDRWNKGQAVQWFEVLFLVPFVLVGLLLVGAVVYTGLQWFVSLLVGEVQVELSDHPLRGGSAARVHVAQAGLFPLGRVRVALVCTEEAIYVAGTSKSTAKQDVVNHPVADPDRSPDGGGLPLTAEFTVPADAMHSFDAPNNKIKWTVRVAGRVLGVFRFRDEYAVGVVPEGRGGP